MKECGTSHVQTGSHVSCPFSDDVPDGGLLSCHMVKWAGLQINTRPQAASTRSFPFCTEPFQSHLLWEAESQADTPLCDLRKRKPQERPLICTLGSLQQARPCSFTAQGRIPQESPHHLVAVAAMVNKPNDCSSHSFWCPKCCVFLFLAFLTLSSLLTLHWRSSRTGTTEGGVHLDLDFQWWPSF